MGDAGIVGSGRQAELGSQELFWTCLLDVHPNGAVIKAAGCVIWS